MQQLNNIDFSVAVKGEMLEVLTNYLMSVYRGYIIQSTLENTTKNQIYFVVSLVEVFAHYGNYFTKCCVPW